VRCGAQQHTEMASILLIAPVRLRCGFVFPGSSQATFWEDYFHKTADFTGPKKGDGVCPGSASDSFNFDLRASANYSAGAIAGNWSESTRNIAGTISGRADGDRFQVVARASSFVATLIVITHGGRQSVVIRSHDAQASIKGASISLKRS
jgi:hypothetical protein